MMDDWSILPLKDCLEKVKITKKILSKDFLPVGEYPIISQEEQFISGYWNNPDDVFRISKPVVIFGDHTQVVKFVDFDFVIGADGIKILQPIKEILGKYLFYFIKSHRLEKLGYARHFRLLRELPVNFPHISEQHRIVAILDEAFAAIDKARTNTQKNLQNVSEVFTTHVKNVFANPSGDWETKKVGEVVSLEYGKPLQQTYRNSTGYYPVYGANGEIDRTNRYFYDRKTIIVGRKGSAGEVNFTEERFWPLDVTFFVKLNEKRMNLNFIYYLFKYLELPKLSKGVKPGINRNEVYSLDVNIPNLSEQFAIVSRLNELADVTKKLSAAYQQKLSDLEELKKSILQKAFNGEL